MNAPLHLSEADRELAEKFSGPVLSIEMAAATEDEEPISRVILRDALRALKLVSALQPGHSPEERGRAIGACDNAAIWLEAELKRTGVLS
jgi:hypothetical protein